MEIRIAQEHDVNALCKFNKAIFPDKKIDSREYINFWLSKDNNALNNITLLVNDNERIVGQTIFSSMSYYYSGKRLDSEWGLDLIIEKEYRQETWGIDLILKNLELHPSFMATGSGPLAKSINLKLGMKDLGNIKKYVGVVNPLYLICSYKKKTIPIKNYPKIINDRTHIYSLISQDELPSYVAPFNEGLLEICRDYDFLKWRFFNKLHQYAFYLRDDKQTYLVLRSISIKGFRVMELVDYRCENTEVNFEEIYQVAVRATRKLKLPIIVCGSSLKSFDKVLERHHLKSIGRPRPILGFLNCKDRKKDIENRNFCFVTFADSDGETNWM